MSLCGWNWSIWSLLCLNLTVGFNVRESVWVLFKLKHKSEHSCCFFLLYVVLLYKANKIIKKQLQLHVWENTFAHLLEKVENSLMCWITKTYSQQPLAAKAVRSKEQKTTFFYQKLNKLHVIVLRLFNLILYRTCNVNFFLSEHRLHTWHIT